MRKTLLAATLLLSSCLPDIEKTKQDLIDEMQSMVEAQADEIQSQIETLGTNTCLVSSEEDKTIYACRTELEDYVLVCVGSVCEKLQ